MAKLSIAILATIFLYLICVDWVCIYIKTTHPAAWAEANEPSPLNHVFRHSLGWGRFIWRDYTRLGDRRLLLIVGIGRGLAVIFAVLLITWLLTR